MAAEYQSRETEEENKHETTDTGDSVFKERFRRPLGTLIWIFSILFNVLGGDFLSFLPRKFISEIIEANRGIDCGFLKKCNETQVFVNSTGARENFLKMSNYVGNVSEFLGTYYVGGNKSMASTISQELERQMNEKVEKMRNSTQVYISKANEFIKKKENLTNVCNSTQYIRLKNYTREIASRYPNITNFCRNESYKNFAETDILNKVQDSYTSIYSELIRIQNSYVNFDLTRFGINIEDSQANYLTNMYLNNMLMTKQINNEQINTIKTDIFSILNEFSYLVKRIKEITSTQPCDISPFLPCISICSIAPDLCKIDSAKLLTDVNNLRSKLSVNSFTYNFCQENDCSEMKDLIKKVLTINDASKNSPRPPLKDIKDLSSVNKVVQESQPTLNYLGVSVKLNSVYSIQKNLTFIGLQVNDVNSCNIVVPRVYLKGELVIDSSSLRTIYVEKSLDYININDFANCQFVIESLYIDYYYNPYPNGYEVNCLRNSIYNYPFTYSNSLCVQPYRFSKYILKGHTILLTCCQYCTGGNCPCVSSSLVTANELKQTSCSQLPPSVSTDLNNYTTTKSCYTNSTYYIPPIPEDSFCIIENVTAPDILDLNLFNYSFNISIPKNYLTVLPDFPANLTSSEILASVQIPEISLPKFIIKGIKVFDLLFFYTEVPMVNLPGTLYALTHGFYSHIMFYLDNKNFCNIGKLSSTSYNNKNLLIGIALFIGCLLLSPVLEYSFCLKKQSDSVYCSQVQGRCSTENEIECYVSFDPTCKILYIPSLIYFVFRSYFLLSQTQVIIYRAISFYIESRLPIEQITFVESNYWIDSEIVVSKHSLDYGHLRAIASILGPIARFACLAVAFHVPELSGVMMTIEIMLYEEIF